MLPNLVDNDSLLRFQLVHLVSLPNEMLRDEFDRLVTHFSENLRENAMIEAYHDQEWGRIVLESDSQDLPF